MPGVMLRYTRRDAKGGQREWPSEGEKGGGGGGAEASLSVLENPANR